VLGSTELQAGAEHAGGRYLKRRKNAQTSGVPVSCRVDGPPSMLAFGPARGWPVQVPVAVGFEPKSSLGTWKRPLGCSAAFSEACSRYGHAGP